jgi:hypothetical protein
MATLKTALTLSSAEFEREFAKAAAVVGKYTQSIETQGNRNLQRARGEIEALRLEATGHQQAAEALRQKITVEEQAAALAKSTGITQQNALKITQRRIELEAKLAAQQARTARISGGGGGGGGRMMLPQVPLTTKEMDRMFIATDRANKELRMMQKSGRNGAMGLMAVSQAVEDAQYGLNGVLNNIPQAVLGFGGSMGLAGAISLAAVAGFQFYKIMMKIAGTADAEQQVKRLTAAMDGFTEAQRKNQQAAADRRREIELGNKLTDVTERETLKQSRTLGVDPGAEAAYQRQQRAEDRARQQRDELMAATSRGAGADPLAAVRAKFVNDEADAADALADAQKRLIDSGTEWERVWKNLRETGGDLFTRAQAAANEAEKIQLLLSGREQELAAMRAENEATTGPAKRQQLPAIRAQEDAVKALTDQLKDLRAEEEAYNKLLEQGRATAAASLAEFTARRDAAKEEIQVNRERITLIRELAAAEAARIQAATAASQKSYREEMEVLRATLAGDQSKLDQLDRQKRIEEEILRLKKEQLGLTDAAARSLAEQKANAQDAVRDKERAQKKQQGRAVELQLGQEMQVLRLRAAGREKESVALEKEFAARAEAVRIAKETGRSEADALKLVRERQALLDKIDRDKSSEKERSRPRSAIYTKTAETLGDRLNASGGRRIDAGAGRRIGLGAAAIDRVRDSRPRDPAAESRRAAENYYQKNLQQNEELLQIWRTLGVA